MACGRLLTPQFLQDVVDIPFGRADTDIQFIGDLLVGFARHDEFQHADLLLTEGIEQLLQGRGAGLTSGLILSEKLAYIFG